MMDIEEARKFANSKLEELIQPLLDREEFDPDDFIKKSQVVKQEILEETGYSVKSFHVAPLGFGVYELTTVFEQGEKPLTYRPAIYLN